jgi:hypothetical protein
MQVQVCRMLCTVRSVEEVCRASCVVPCAVGVQAMRRALYAVLSGEEV